MDSPRILCLDVGDRRIGVAVGDVGIALARPLTVIQRKGGRPDLDAVAQLAREHNVERIVVGLPRSLDGTLGPQARKVQAFVAALTRYVDTPIEMWDEQFSTVEAERLMAETGVRREKRRGQVDAIAAAVVLQSYLDSRRAAPSATHETKP